MARVSATIKLHVSELLFDIQNKTYLTGRSRNDGTNFEAIAAMQVNDDDENKFQILRSIQTALSAVKQKLGDYISGDSVSSSNKLDETTTTVSLTLSLPENYNKADLDSVTNGIHEFIVNTALSEWFLITNKAEAADYASLATANIAMLREGLSKRNKPTRTAPTDSESK